MCAPRGVTSLCSITHCKLEAETVKRSHNQTGNESMWKRVNYKWVLRLATMQWCWPRPRSVATALSITAPLQSFSVSLFSAAEPLTCSCSPSPPPMAEDPQPACRPFLEATDEGGWMDSAAHCIRSQSGPVSQDSGVCADLFNEAQLCSLLQLHLASVCIAISLWVWRHYVHLGVVPSALVASFSRREANRIYKDLCNGWVLNYLYTYICK